ncbi:MAG: hypothetical protein WDO69_03245 [Pseudomonadota bacterium]
MRIRHAGQAQGLWWGTLALAVACGGGSRPGFEAAAGAASQMQGGDAGSSEHVGGNAMGGGTNPSSAGVGNASGVSSASGGWNASGGIDAAGSGGSAGTNANSVPKCAPAQIFCNGSCLEKVGDSASNCSAVFLEASQTSSLAADGTFLYFTHANLSIDRLDISSLATTSLVTGIKFPANLVLDAEMLYFTTTWTEPELGSDFAKGTLRKVPKAGGTVTVLAQNLDSPDALALSAGFLYFTTGTFTPVQLNRESVGGPSPTQLSGVLPTGVKAFVVDAGTVYYRNNSGIVATPLSDLSQSAAVAPNVAADVLLSDTDNLYFFDTPSVGSQSQTNYERVDKSGSVPQIVHLSEVLRFQYRDSEASYLVGPNLDGEQKLYRIPLTGASVDAIARFEHDQVAAVTSDESSVYVGTNAGGIVRIMK